MGWGGFGWVGVGRRAGRLGRGWMEREARAAGVFVPPAFIQFFFFFQLTILKFSNPTPSLTPQVISQV